MVKTESRVFPVISVTLSAPVKTRRALFRRRAQRFFKQNVQNKRFVSVVDGARQGSACRENIGRLRIEPFVSRNSAIVATSTSGRFRVERAFPRSPPRRIRLLRGPDAAASPSSTYCHGARPACSHRRQARAVDVRAETEPVREDASASFEMFDVSDARPPPPPSPSRPARHRVRRSILSRPARRPRRSAGPSRQRRRRRRPR